MLCYEDCHITHENRNFKISLFCLLPFDLVICNYFHFHENLESHKVKCRLIFIGYLHSWTARCLQTGCRECVASSWNHDHIDTTARKQWPTGSACSYWPSCDMFRAVPRPVSIILFVAVDFLHVWIEGQFHYWNSNGSQYN